MLEKYGILRCFFSQQKKVVSQHLAISIGGDFYYNIRKKQIKISIEI